jgi:flagellar biosynthesis/type III secretory pathway M-ring protein FliF/YscJ
MEANEVFMNTNAVIALVVMILLIVVINFSMFGIVRGMTRGDNRWMNALRDSLTKPTERSNQPYDELRQKMQELSGEEKKEEYFLDTDKR